MIRNAKEALTRSLDQHERHLAISRPFVETYGEKLPPYLSHLYLGIHEQPVFEINARFGSASDRDRLLALIGDVFGREGWLGKLSASGTGYDWKKDVGGVIVRIENAEVMPSAQGEFAVPPSKFPLQLTT